MVGRFSPEPVPLRGSLDALLLSALFLSAIYVGADSMSRGVNIPTYIADVLVATSMLAVVLSVMLARFRIRFS